MKEEENDTRVDTMGEGSHIPTASTVQAGSGAPITPNQVSDVLHELDSYRSVIRGAFDEGYAASSNRMPIEHAWERSGSRQAEWHFAHTRMSVGGLVRRLAATSDDGHTTGADSAGSGAPRTVNGGTRDKSPSSSSLAHPEQGWQPIETIVDAPIHGMKFNCLVSDGLNVWEAWYDVGHEAFYEPNAERGDEYERQLFPTHWMPLPLPPSPTDSEKKK